MTIGREIREALPNSLAKLKTSGRDILALFLSQGTYTAASARNYFGSDGLLASAAINIPRLAYDPATLTPIGFQIEGAATNLLTAPRDGTNAAWSKTDTTAALNQIGIDGVANSATLYTEGSAGTGNVSQAGVVTAGSAITHSQCLKRGNTDWVRVGCTDGAGNGALAWFNLLTGAAGTLTTIGTATGTSSSVVALANGFYRCSVTATPSGVYTTTKAEIQSASANGSGTRVSNSTYIVDYAQLETGTAATSPIIGTRAADVDSFPLAGLYNGVSGTVVVEFRKSNAPTSAVTVITLGSGNDVITCFISGTSIFVQSYVAGALKGSVTLVSPSLTALNKVVFAFTATRLAASLNGAAVVSNALTGIPATAANAYLGISDAGTQQLNGFISRATIYTSALPDATLRALST